MEFIEGKTVLDAEQDDIELPKELKQGLAFIKDNQPDDRPKPCFGNGDLNPMNFICTESGDIAVVDWEYAGFNDPIAELMLLHTWPEEDPFLRTHPIDRLTEDENESPLWREFNVQFLGQSISKVDGPVREQIQKKLENLAEFDKTERSMTALVQLNLQEQAGNISLDKEKYDAMLFEKMEDVNVSIANKSTVLALWGQRRDKDKLPIIRKFAKYAKLPDLRRTAVASLGLMGEKEDIAIVKANLALKPEFKPLTLACQGALKRLKKRFPEEFGQGS